MKTPPPIPCTWDGDAFVPLPRYAIVCDKAFAVDEVYPLVVHEERSQKNHNHYFACIHDAWMSLREEYAKRFPTEEHLRKYALIRTGYTNSRAVSTSSHEQAERLAAFIAPIDEYAIVTVDDCLVTVWTALSQSRKEMGKQRFSESKQAVLDLLASMIGVTSDELSSEAGRAA